MSSDRPVFLNLTRLQYPVGALASIGHRISGVVLLCVLVAVAWACAQHLLAGARHLLSDVDIGSSLQSSRKSAVPST